MVPILAEPNVLDHFSKQKSNLNFSQRSDSEFIRFLLDTTISIVSIVKQISPVIKAIEEKIGPEILATPEGLPTPEANINDDEEDCDTLKSEFVDSNAVVAQLSEEMSLLIENLSSLQETANLHEISSSDIPAMPQSDVDMAPEIEKTVLGESYSEEEAKDDREQELTATTPTTLAASDATGAEIQCNVCSEMVDRTDLLEHMKQHESKGWHCHYCDKTFSLRTYLVKHKKRYHSDRRFRCTVCDRTYDSHTELQRHSHTHSLEAPFRCETCSKKFAHYSSLKRHQVSHTGVKNFKCEMCGRTFMRKDSLNNHKLMSCPRKIGTAKNVLSGLSMLGSGDQKNTQQFLDAKILEVLSMERFSS